MKTTADREALAIELLGSLNQMAKAQCQIIASTDPIQGITLTDLLALSDAELDSLKTLVEKTQSAKQTQKQTKRYDDFMKPKAIISDVFEKPKYSIVC